MRKEDVIQHLKAALSLDPQAMALLHQITAEVNLARAPGMQDPQLPRQTSRGFWWVVDQHGVGLNRAVCHVASEWMTYSLDEIARLVYRLDDVPFLVGLIRIMQS